jgi:hypothetical protein
MCQIDRKVLSQTLRFWTFFHFAQALAGFTGILPFTLHVSQHNAGSSYTCTKTKLAMRKVFYLMVVSMIFASCVVVKVPPGQAKKPAAPGQVKKTTGSKSAAPYAPGQQKKAATPAAKKKN